MGLPAVAIAVLFAIVLLISAVRIYREYERAVLFRLGRYVGLRGPGIFLIVPIVDRVVKVSLRTVVMDVPPQDVITRDNVSVKVNAVLYFRVFEPQKAVLEVENFLFATSQLAQTTLRSIVGGAELDELLAEREKINRALQEIIDRQTDPWGIKVISVEVKDVDLPTEMKRAMARDRPKPSASGAPRSSMPKASTRPHSGWPMPPESSATTRWPCSCASCKRSARWQRRTTRRRSSPSPST